MLLRRLAIAGCVAFATAATLSGSGDAGLAQGGTGTWRLVRTPNPQGGQGAVSIMQTADSGRSDPDLAGVMLRCAAAGIEVAVVLVEPLSPRAKPTITLNSGGEATQFPGTVVAPGALIVLGGRALSLVTSPRAAEELSLIVQNDQTKVQGVISLAGLPAAFGELQASCALR